MKTIILIGMLGLVGCSDATRSKIFSYGSGRVIKCYSGGKLIYRGKSTGKIRSEENSDGYYFVEQDSGRLMEVSGDCVLSSESEVLWDTSSTIATGDSSWVKKAFEWLIDNKGWRLAPSVSSAKEGDRIAVIKVSRSGCMYTFLEDMNSLKSRRDPDLIECLKVLGDEAFGKHSKLIIIDVGNTPEESLEIVECGGMETLQTIPKRFN